MESRYCGNANIVTLVFTAPAKPQTYRMARPPTITAGLTAPPDEEESSAAALTAKWIAPADAALANPRRRATLANPQRRKKA